MLNYTPHIIIANKSGYPDGSIQSNITESKSDTVILGQTVSSPSETPIVILGDWIINETISYNNKTIIVDNGNVIINNDGSLNLDNVLLQLRYTSNAGYGIEVKNGGYFNVSQSNITTFYPELNIRYYFRNYGYLNIQNSSVSWADSIYFYDSSDDSSVINGSRIENNNYGVYIYSSSPNITNNEIINNINYGIFTYRHYAFPHIFNNLIQDNNGGIGVYYYSRPVIENNKILNNKNYGINSRPWSSGPGQPEIIGNTISGHTSYGIYYSASLIENNTISDNYYGIYLYSGLTDIINNTIFNHTYYGIYLYSANANIIDTKISNSSQKDLYISGTTYVKSINSTFNLTLTDK